MTDQDRSRPSLSSAEVSERLEQALFEIRRVIAGKDAMLERVLVCPVGFVSDHLEIRWDLDVEASEKAAELGLRFGRIEMPNADPVFVRTLAGIVRRALSVPSAT